jgi:F-type H+-transporting ATPase subunit b
LDLQQGEGLTSSVQNANTGVLISTAFPLPDITQEELTTAVQECLADQSEYAQQPQQPQQQCPVRFECAPDLVCGIELKTPGHKIGWSIGHYLRTLEDGVLTALEEESRERDEYTNRTADRLR